MRVRDMTADDVDAVAELRVRAWRFAYAGLMPQPYLDALSVTEDAARRRETFAAAPAGVGHLVAEEADGTVTGWACVGPCRDTDRRPVAGEPADGELYALYVHPERIGRGTGRALLAAALDRAAGAGFPVVRLWVVEGNKRARRFYERAGFAPDGARETGDVDGVPVPEVRYRYPA